jgi:Lon protease-like protein
MARKSPILCGRRDNWSVAWVWSALCVSRTSSATLLAPARTHGTWTAPAAPLRSRARALASSGGDLRGGEDRERNARVSALKKLFYTPLQPAGCAADDGLTVACGVRLDLPVCRWSFPLLPGAQRVLNVFQAEYVHLFEELLAREAAEGERLYAHVLLPGGLDNLASDEYALRPGTRAPLVGTLMRVLRCDRMADSRLRLVVQGVARVRVLRERQTLPYARADVRILPDAEELASADAAAGDAEAAAPPTADEVRAAAAVGASSAWAAYEAADITRVPGALQETYYGVQGPWAPALVPLNGSALEPCARRAATAARAAGDAVVAAARAGASAEWSAAWTADVAHDAERQSARRALDLAMSAASSESRLRELELALWLRLDRLLALLHALRPNKTGPTPVPASMLGLLPPPPAAGWPTEFRCADVAAEHAAAALDAPGLGGYVAVDARYPALRRAQRLGYAVWEVIGTEGESTQPVLEAASVAERLTLALAWVDDMTDKVLANR